MRIRVWSVTRQCQHPPSMSAGAGLGAESVLASVLGRTAALPHCRSLHTPGHCTLGLSSAIRSLHFLAVNMTQKLQCSSNNVRLQHVPGKIFFLRCVRHVSHCAVSSGDTLRLSCVLLTGCAMCDGEMTGLGDSGDTRVLYIVFCTVYVQAHPGTLPHRHNRSKHLLVLKFKALLCLKPGK